ncbi:hypothetical protein G9A89_002917 [Geosiphon pyriformis]|nr:hypothetical protein G9A89_002917 [Geosiphon pyriformis]
MLRKRLKLKANLPKNFPNETLYYSELYGLRTFEQVLAENILAGLVVFVNADGILGKLFEHRTMELQATSWMFQHSLRVSINLLIDLTNCFLAGVTHVLKLCNLSLGGNLPDVFWAKNSIAVLDVLGLKSYLCVARSLRRYGIVFVHQLLDCQDSSVKSLGLLSVCDGAATYFPDANISIGVKVDELLSSTLVELQAIALVLECVPTSQSINLFTDSQTSLNLCESGGDMFSPNFHDKCWIKKEHIRCIISRKDLSVNWNKVKSHSGVVGNECANFYADATVASKFFLPLVVFYYFLRVEDRPVSGNACHVVKKLFNAVHFVSWEAKCVGSFISAGFCDCFDKAKTFCVWHPDGKIKYGYTSNASVTLQSYLIKVLHHHLPMAKRKKLYNLRYPSIVCIWCGLVEDSNHVFSCVHDANIRETLLFDASME